MQLSLREPRSGHNPLIRGGPRRDSRMQCNAKTAQGWRPSKRQCVTSQPPHGVNHMPHHHTPTPPKPCYPSKGLTKSRRLHHTRWPPRDRRARRARPPATLQPARQRAVRRTASASSALPPTSPRSTSSTSDTNPSTSFFFMLRGPAMPRLPATDSTLAASARWVAFARIAPSSAIGGGPVHKPLHARDDACCSMQRIDALTTGFI